MTDRPSESSPTPAPAAQSSPSAEAPKESAASTFKQLGPAGILGIIATVLPPIGGTLIIVYMPTISEWLRSHGWQGLALYTVGFMFFAGLALLPTYSQAALGGFAFGTAVGLPAALLGFVGAAVIGSEIARRAGGDRVEIMLRKKPRWQAMRDALLHDHEARGFWKTTGMIALVRFPPNSPFALTNVILASLKVPRLQFLIGTLIGMAPRTAVAVAIGSTVQQFTKESLESAVPRWVLIAGVVATIAVVGIIGLLANRAISRIAARPLSPLPPKPADH